LYDSPAVLTPEILGRALGEAPDPELARIAVSRMEGRPGVRELLERPEIIQRAARLLGFSTAASDFFTAHPEELEALSDPAAQGLDGLTREAEAAVEALGPPDGLRRFRRRATYRVAARDLAGASPDEVMAELSDIAEACLAVAVRTIRAAGDLAVIGMGKLGGRELNYASDVDVLFVHGRTGKEAQEVASRAAAALVALLSEPTSEGVALRVDANLRPEGRAGPLSRSLDSMREYYATYAATWERQALLKARPVAGDEEIGMAFVAAVTPFVFPAILPASAIDDVRASKARIEELVRASGKDAVEVKRGRGGIRDVEFAVQLLQLVHGRRHERLHQPNTLAALASLAEEGFVSLDDALALSRSYRFLRQLEHRLQMVRDLQTHELPADRRALGSLARSMGLPSADHLLAEHARHTNEVRRLHERLFYRPLMKAFAGPAAPRAGVDRPATEELLGGLGFGDPAAAYQNLAGIFEPTSRLGRVLGTLFPVIAPSLAFSAIPDAALVRFGRVVEGLHLHPNHDRVADTLADRPDAARRLAALVAVSSAFADALVAGPELVSALVQGAPLQPPLFPGDARADLVRVAGAYAAGEISFPESGRRLATVADGLFASAFATADPRVPLAVIGMGRLGSEELSFASDLDVLFVYEGEGPADYEMAGRAAERILSEVNAAGWRADANLRPEGRAGPLARSMASYLEYWERWAETWEYQALLRGRFVGGDESLGRRFLSNAADFAFPEALTFEQVAAIRRMRVRMEEERVRPAEARRFHFKLGYGSLADVQWAVELSLMRHGFGRPEVRKTNTLEALEALAAARLLEDSVASALGEAYVFLSDVKNALEIERRVPVAALPPVPEDQAALARRLGYIEQPRHLFLQDYRRITRRARLAMERVFYGEPTPDGEGRP
jgi:[glutamine synthetase] adenylyltransferase / [glutamine synthetase]-adenylyl-L-tyrosine phosphorylase